MYMKSIKYLLATLIASISAVSMTMEFKVEYDGSTVDMKINGKNSTDLNVRHLMARYGLGFVGAGIAMGAMQIKTPEPGKQTDASDAQKVGICAGMYAGFIAADALYGKVTKKTVSEDVGEAVGLVVGVSFAKKRSMNEALFFWPKIGRAVVAQAHGDMEQARLLVGRAVGGQLGRRLTSDARDLVGLSVGDNLGAAVMAPNIQARNFYLKKAGLQATSLYATENITSKDTWLNLLRYKTLDIASHKLANRF